MAGRFPPGSFTKNIGGYGKLHHSIRVAYTSNMTLSDLRIALAGVMRSDDQALVVTEYFLATLVVGGKERVFHDALVEETLRRETYDPLLARLYLFALILNNPGQRIEAAHKAPAAAQNAFVREYLYQDIGWVAERLDKAEHMRPWLAANLDAKQSTVRKFTTNLYYFFKQCSFPTDQEGYLKTFAEHWGPVALKLFFQRHELVHGRDDVAELEQAAQEAEVHKLLGIPEAWFDNVIEGAADAYYSGRDEPFVATVEEEEDREPEAPRRQTQQVSTFARLREHRERLRGWYEGRCQVCGGRLGGRGEATFDAAHIQALQYGGPDVIENILSLCPNHHRQVDLGTLGIKPDTREVMAPYGTAPAPQGPLILHEEHHVERYLKWHYRHVFREDI